MADTEYTKGFKAGLAWQQKANDAIRQDAFAEGHQYGAEQIIKMLDEFESEDIYEFMALLKEQYGPE